MRSHLCDITRCDEIARLYLPQVRAELVYRLVTTRGIPQARVARWMGITRAAVSQYISRKRGFGDINISQDLDDIIEAWAEGIITGEGSVTICDLCNCINNTNNMNNNLKNNDNIINTI
ncbi:MAG: transcriptional regulator [Methanomicrobium sp.]|nr:transcriptional regulator [Methanomicrobium sp.]